MRQVLLSFFILFVTFSCSVEKPVEIINLDFQMTETFQMTGEIFVSNEKNLTTYEIGIIYQMSLEEESKKFSINDNVNKTEVEIAEDGKFNYTLDTSEFRAFDYLLRITFRGYSISPKGKITYSKETKSATFYELAKDSESVFALNVKEKVSENIIFDEGLEVVAMIDEEAEGYDISVSFNNIMEDNIYGLIYKKEALYEERENLNFSSEKIKLYYGSLEDDKLSLLFNNVLKEDYLKEITFRAFIYVKETNSFILSEEVITISLYELALNNESEYAKSVVKYVHEQNIIIEEIFINTDVTKEYEVYSYSEGITVAMFFDYLDVVLTIEVLPGYRFSSNLGKENIIILRVDDGIMVSKFEMEMTGTKIVITYDDYGWGPPM